MKKLFIAPPLHFSNRQNYQSIFSILFLPLGVIAFYYYIWNVKYDLPIYAHLISLFFLVISPISIAFYIRNIQASKQTNIILDDNGITIKDSEERTVIEWNNISHVYAAFVLKRNLPDKEQRTGFPFLLIKTNNKANIPDIDGHTKDFRKMEVPFIKSKDFFYEYIGLTHDFDFAINIENQSEKDAKEMFEKLPINITRIRPLMDVSSEEEYNTLLAEITSPEFFEEYKL